MAGFAVFAIKRFACYGAKVLTNLLLNKYEKVYILGNCVLLRNVERVKKMLHLVRKLYAANNSFSHNR